MIRGHCRIRLRVKLAESSHGNRQHIIINLKGPQLLHSQGQTVKQKVAGSQSTGPTAVM